jgi:hypothetical protein
MAWRSLVAEFATAVGVSEWTMARQLGDAEDLCDRFEPLVAALEQGRLSLRHVGIVHDAGRAIIDDADRAEFVALALDRSAGTTPGRLKPIVESLAARFRAAGREERLATAEGTRGIRLIDASDSMSDLVVTVASTLAHGIFDRLTEQARQVVESSGVEDERTLDQVRADVLTDLLLAGTPQTCASGDGLGAIRASVQIEIPVLTALGVGDAPCELVGCGPIPMETALRLAADSPTWTRVMTSPVTGQALAVDSYRPTAELRRFLGVRDERCRFPGCRRAAARSEIDHTVDAALGGPTVDSNLGHLCARHHTLKHASPWAVEQVEPGVFVWTSPAGHRHTDVPDRQVRFVQGMASRSDAPF